MARAVDRDRYRLLFDTTPCYITVQDPRFRIVEYNRRFEDDFGPPGRRCCYEVYKGRAEVCDECPVARVFEDGEPHQSEEMVITRSGETRFVWVHAAPLLDPEGRVKEVMEVSTDITELKELQSRMASVGRLVASLAHTVKGIVMSLDGGIYVMNTGFEKDRDEMVRKGWEIVQRNIGRVTTLVLDMLQYAREREPVVTPVDLEVLVREVTELFAEKFRRSGVECRVEAGELVEIEADEHGLHSLLVSLLENAVDACHWDVDRDEHRITVRLRHDPAAHEVELSVEDDGIGMDQETVNRLFTPMFSTKRGGGTGLGLLVARKIAGEHGGRIEVDSTPGRGSTFTVRLPVRRRRTGAEGDADLGPGPGGP